jgi:hypothetical protein
MRDLESHLAKLIAKAFACRRVAMLAADPAERADLKWQAEQYMRMAEALRIVLAEQEATEDRQKSA